MKTILKQLIALAVVAGFAFPALAAETAKGTKSYQSRAEKSAQTINANKSELQGAEEVAKIAPAAGDAAEAKTSFKDKTLREEMRLPRKN